MVGGFRDGDMERDVELKLTAQVASLEGTFDGFAKDALRRLDRIETQTTATNGRVTRLEERMERLPKDAITLTSLRAFKEFGGWIVAGGMAAAKLLGAF